MPVHSPHLRTYIIVLLVLLAFAGVIFFMHIGGEVKPAVPYTPTRGDVPQGFSNATPAPTPADFTDKQKPFQQLVSFIGAGFVPNALDAGVGETIRFTNNAHSAVVVTTEGTSSPTLQPGEYWQHTYRTAGVFTFSYGSLHGAITVK